MSPLVVVVRPMRKVVKKILAQGRASVRRRTRRYAAEDQRDGLSSPCLEDHSPPWPSALKGEKGPLRAGPQVLCARAILRAVVVTGSLR
jgi:hypothetical protein